MKTLADGTRKKPVPRQPKNVKAAGDTVDPLSKPKYTDVAGLMELKAKNPGLTQAQLGKLAGISKQAVSQLFQRYGIDHAKMEEYKVNRADIFAGLQETVLRTLTEEDIKKASVRDRIIAAATLYDKERLERGQSTSNVSVLFSVSDAAEKLRRGEAETVVDITPKASTGAAPDGGDDTH